MSNPFYWDYEKSNVENIAALMLSAGFGTAKFMKIDEKTGKSKAIYIREIDWEPNTVKAEIEYFGDEIVAARINSIDYDNVQAFGYSLAKILKLNAI